MNKVENYFDRIAKEFDLHYKEEETFIDKIINEVFREKTLQRRMKYTIDEIKNDAKNKTVLDIGCGPGHYSVILSKMGAKVTAIDISKEMIQEAKKNSEKLNAKNIKFFVENFLNSNFKNKFDYSFAIGFADYTNKQELNILINNMKQITKKKFIISFPKLFTLQTPIRKTWLYFRNCPVYFYKKSDLIRLFKRHDLKYILKDCDANILAILEK